MRKIIGYTDGTFDLFHVGHLRLLKEAKKHCDILIVGVHGDDVVASYKGKPPIINENDRAEIIRNLAFVDKVVINRTRDKIELLKLYGFNLMIIGDDWKGTERWNKLEKQLNEHGVDVLYLPYTKTISTTAIKKRVLDLYGKEDC